MIVQKYGGSSVGTPEKIKNVAARVARARNQGQEVVVVVSAMGDTTDELIALAHQIAPRPHDREMDVLLTAGERISMALLSMALREVGQEAISFTGSQAGILTDESHTRARIMDIRPIRVREELLRGKVVIVAGFQGVSRAKEITTLGRGGSDTTAVALAVALGADRCEIFTDVRGIFSADPRLVNDAVHYQKLPLDLVHTMATLGAQVMHARAIEIARERGFPLYVGQAHSNQEGTMIVPESMILELPKIVAVTAKRGLAEIVFSAAETSAVLGQLAEGSVLVHGVVMTPAGGLSILLDPTESGAFLARHAAAKVTTGVAAVSVVGYQLQANAQLAARVVATLERAGIRPAGLTTHPQSITVWFSESTSENLCAQAVQSLHEALIGR